MPKHTAIQVRTKTEMVKKIIKHHFGKAPKKIQFKPAGLTNFVFDVKSSEGEFIVRIARARTKTNDFIKEQWVTERVRERGVPVPEILEVGTEIISLPYMLQRKLEGKEAVDHPKRLDILYNLGSYARLIHSVPTSNFGKVFDWSQNRLSKNETWIDFLEDELDFTNRLKIFKKANIFTNKKLNKLTILYERIKKWKIAPKLNHGDLRLKNVLANDAGKIIAIIDWENCISSIAPYWDFSIALHDLSMDGKQQFMEGYGLDFNEFSRMAYSLKVFNVVNYAQSIEKIIAKNQMTKLDYYRLRLNGYLDLFSL